MCNTVKSNFVLPAYNCQAKFVPTFFQKNPILNSHCDSDWNVFKKPSLFLNCSPGVEIVIFSYSSLDNFFKSFKTLVKAQNNVIL